MPAVPLLSPLRLKSREPFYARAKLGGADDRIGDYQCVLCTNLARVSGLNQLEKHKSQQTWELNAKSTGIG